MKGIKAMERRLSMSERLQRSEERRRRVPLDDEPLARPKVAAAGSILDIAMGVTEVYEPPIEWLKAEWRRMEGRRKRLWTPNQGVNRIRIVAVKGQQGFYVQVPWHFDVGPRKRGMPCRSRIAQACYVCERVEALAESPDLDGREQAEAMQVKYRFLVQIIDVDDPDRGVQVWVTTEAMINKLIARMIDPDWRDLLDPKVGRTVTFTRQGEGKMSRYSDPRPSPNPSPIPYTAWQDELKNFDDYLAPKSYLEQQRIYEGDDGVAGNGAKSRSATKGLGSEDF
jgi:hypothetical protein